MKAFKTFAQMPKDLILDGVPLGYPAVVQECSNKSEAEAQGFTVLEDNEYDNYVLNMAGELAAWEATRLRLTIETVVESAQDFGKNLVITFSAENILLGITALGMTGQVSLVTKDIVSALNTGSLYEAITQAKSIPAESKDAIFVTDARMLLFINKIETYLGIALSESL